LKEFIDQITRIGRDALKEKITERLVPLDLIEKNETFLSADGTESIEMEVREVRPRIGAPQPIKGGKDVYMGLKVKTTLNNGQEIPLVTVSIRENDVSHSIYFSITAAGDNQDYPSMYRVSYYSDQYTYPYTYKPNEEHRQALLEAGCRPYSELPKPPLDQKQVFCELLNWIVKQVDSADVPTKFSPSLRSVFPQFYTTPIPSLE